MIRKRGPNAALKQAGAVLFFFFQAEDGIRDDLVTGVQTCALPIFDLITAAQAAHWFNHEQARREFLRILKPGGRPGSGWVVLIWNERRTDSTPLDRKSVV